MGFNFGKNNKLDTEIKTEELFKDKTYSLLETISILKYKANSEKIKGQKIQIINTINQLRLLINKFMTINKETAKDICMQISFDLGEFCNQFNNLCLKLDLQNPLKGLSLSEIFDELEILNQIDAEYFSNNKLEIYNEDNFSPSYNTYDFKIYDTLFYLNNHCIVGYDIKELEIDKIFQDIDNDLSKLKEFISNRKELNANENLAFYIGGLIEALATIAHDYDIPNELNISFDLSFIDIINKLDLAFKQIDRFKEAMEDRPYDHLYDMYYDEFDDILDDENQYNDRN